MGGNVWKNCPEPSKDLNLTTKYQMKVIRSQDIRVSNGRMADISYHRIPLLHYINLGVKGRIQNCGFLRIVTYTDDGLF